jgi:adenylate cyclase
MGIGINCGELVVGNIGSEKRMKYGAVGSPINIAFRVEAQTEGGQILITEQVHDRLDQSLIIGRIKEVTLKGFDEPMSLYEALEYQSEKA